MTSTASPSTVVKVRNKIVPIRRTGWQDKVFVSLGHDAEEEYLRSVVKQVAIGNSDGVKVSTSIMVYGPPGCGKSQLVDRVVKSIEVEFSDVPFDVIRLEGVYCFNLQDSVTEICNQIMEDPHVILEGLSLSDSTPLDERLEAVLFYLKNKLMDMKKSLVIIIDGMEKFTDDSSQRLLYNLFDISANAVFSVPICIVGITPCVDILDSFEKRVRSRFSHRQINLIPRIEFSQYLMWTEQLLSHSKEEQWNAQVATVLKNQDVIKTLRLLYDSDKSIGQLRKLLYVATLTCRNELSVSDIQDSYTQLHGSLCHVQMAIDLPLSELVVLLGIFKKIQRSQQAWQPSQIFEIIRKSYSLYQLRKDDFIKTIIKFQNLEFIIPVGSHKHVCSSNLIESYFKCEISYVEFQEIWKKYPNLPSFFSEYL